MFSMFFFFLLAWECFDKQDYRESQGVTQIAELTFFFNSFLLELTLFINDTYTCDFYLSNGNIPRAFSGVGGWYMSLKPIGVKYF